MNPIGEPVLKSLSMLSLINLAADCLKEARARNYESLPHYERDAVEIALHYLAPLEYPEPKQKAGNGL
jgi:hypothetical protein